MTWLRELSVVGGMLFLLYHFHYQHEKLDENPSFIAYTEAKRELMVVEMEFLTSIDALQAQLPTRAICEEQYALGALYYATVYVRLQRISELGTSTLTEVGIGRINDRNRLRQIERELFAHRLLALEYDDAYIDHVMKGESFIDRCISPDPPI